MDLKTGTTKPKMLLHVCCANCLLHPYDTLKADYDITLYFYNPNIFPRQEYKKRLSEVKRISALLGIPMIAGRYESLYWYNIARSLEDEPEGGKRCDRCFCIRLYKTAICCKKENFDIFASTLSVSPHKNAEKINDAGNSIAEKLDVLYLPSNFKKNEGFKKTMKSARRLNIYRQNYCGCIYSMPERRKK